MIISKDDKTYLVRMVQDYFEREQMEAIGNIASEQLIDFMMDHLGPIAYNEGVKDVFKLIKVNQDHLEDEIYVLEKPSKR
ncbi:MAG: DUF2164 family protein [Clostridia bacterium]|nr:DUF2164 family protein [Clostridia bacterium]